MKYRSKASSLMGPKIKHASRQYEYVDLPLREANKKKGGSCTGRETDGPSYLLCRDALFLVEAGLGALLV